jgi:hypothetical protein
VWALAAHDESDAGRVARGWDDAGEFGDLRAVAWLTVSVERGNPVLARDVEDRLPDVFGDGHVGGEPRLNVL